MDFLSFDLGASSGKMFRGVFDGERLTLSPVHAFANSIIPMGEGLYWDFPGIYSRMCEGIRKAMAEKPFASFGIDSFNNDFSFIAQNGDLLSPLRSYRDSRTSRHAETIYQKISPRELYMYTGYQLAPFNTFMQIAAMQEEGQSYLFSHSHRLLFLADLLGYYITSQEYTEYSVAAETQMLDWSTRSWIKDLLKHLQVPERLFAPLVMPGTIVGDSSSQFCSQNQVSSFSHVAVCEHDTASAFLAAPAARNTAILSCGTWSVLGAETDGPIINEYGFINNIANEGSLPGHHRILYNVMGLWIMQQLWADYSLHGKKFDHERTKSLALEAEPFSCFINPDDASFYQPMNMVNRVVKNRKADKNTVVSNEPGVLFRCVYESLAFQYRWALEKLENLLGQKFSAVSMIGGGAQDEVLCQFTANALNLPVISGPYDASSIGNILVQMKAHGEISSIEQGRLIVQRSFALREFMPQRADIWNDNYLRFLRLVHSDQHHDPE